MSRVSEQGWNHEGDLMHDALINLENAKRVSETKERKLSLKSFKVSKQVRIHSQLVARANFKT